ncbi:MAG: glycosyltransferase family A protein, partial [Thermodesulfobacteriota bacterium]
EALLHLTLTSVLAQTDSDFRVIIMGHDRPEALPDDSRIAFVKANWPAEAVRADNRDRGRKAHAINQLVLENGGGLLMFLDADDWVDVNLVETAHSMIGPDHVGGLIETGFAADFQTLRAAPLPDSGVFPDAFHRICGSSAVSQLRPGDPDPLRGNPYPVLHEHHRLVETAKAHGADLARLPVAGSYVINTSDNHSEVHGP